MLKTKRISDLPIEKAMKKHGWDALVSPWEYGIQPDTMNAEGTSFWVIPSCTAYLRADPVSGSKDWSICIHPSGGWRAKGDTYVPGSQELLRRA